MHLSKTPERYFSVDPWMIIEEGFDPLHQRIAESVFASANEYMCVRGYFEEGYSGNQLQGSYFNQLYDYIDYKYPNAFNGFVDKGACMINAVDWLYTRIMLDGEQLDLAKVRFSDFRRATDMRTALVKREFVWTTAGGKKLKLKFERFTNADQTRMGCQRVSFEPLNFSGTVEVVAGLDFNTLYEIAGGFDHTKEGAASKDSGADLNFWSLEKIAAEQGLWAIQARTRRSDTHLFSSFRLESEQELHPEVIEKPEAKWIGVRFGLKLTEGASASFRRMAVHHWAMGVPPDDVWQSGMEWARGLSSVAYEQAWQAHCAFWEKAWEIMDIEIKGDPEMQQAIRYALFIVFMNYHGEDEHKNVLCKLAGEVYNGWNFWDTEIYCERMYLFMDPAITRKLLMYRYHFLGHAIEEARRVGLKGARYPFGTVSGKDDTGVWQHCDLEIHQNGAIFYAIWHYVKISGDKAFLYHEGIEMLVQMCRCMASWGGWSPKRGDFGFYGVMGPDEFHMMVNNNCYTNVLGKKMFDYTVAVLDELKGQAPELYQKVLAKLELQPGEPPQWKRMADHMRIPKDEASGIYEQYDGYFDLPHLDIGSLTMDQIPIYKTWPYIKIFRFNMLKQPDFLNLMYFFGNEYPLEEKKANYEFYEARTIHESSMSPALHSILAAELGKTGEAYEFLAYASRLDLDNYNRNTDQGLHSTASSGVWAGIVSGFGGMRTDGELLQFAPSIPEQWESFRFRIVYRESLLEVAVDGGSANFRVLRGQPLTISIYGKAHCVGAAPVGIQLQARDNQK